MSEYMSVTEKRIVGDILTRAFVAGLVVSVNDGGEWVVRRSNDRAVILAAMASTGMDTLAFYDAAGNSQGVIYLVWGNDEDVVCDHTDNKMMAALVGF